ncbi:uncharacterized protein LAESUDRAFT_622149, partial [Laetiporus sulphureus 93-53]
ILFQRLGFSNVNSRIVAVANGTEYFLASFIAIGLVDRLGQQPLILFGQVGQTITMMLLAVSGAINTPGCRVVSVVLLFVFNTFFAVGLLRTSWL